MWIIFWLVVGTIVAMQCHFILNLGCQSDCLFICEYLFVLTTHNLIWTNFSQFLPQLYWYLCKYYKIFFNRNHPDTLVQFFSFILQVKIFKHILYCLKTAGWFEFEYKQCSCGEAISKTGYKGKTQRLMSLTMPCKFFTCFAYSKYALCFDNVYDDNQNGKDLSSSPHK